MNNKMKRNCPSLQQLAYIQAKKLKVSIPETIKNEIESIAAIKIQRLYRSYAGFKEICKNIQNIKVTKNVLVRIILHGLTLNINGISRKLDNFQRLYEIRFAFHKLIRKFLEKKSGGISQKQLKDILAILTKDQLLTLGYGLDPLRLKRSTLYLV